MKSLDILCWIYRRIRIPTFAWEHEFFPAKTVLCTSRMFSSDQKALIYLLSQPNSAQARAVLRTLSNDQTNFIGEIAFNALRLFRSEPGWKETIEKYKSELRLIANRKLPIVRRQALIVTHAAKVLEIIKRMRDVLEDV